MEVTSITKRQKVRFQKSNVKIMLVCFYDSKGIIHHEFVPEGQTVTGSFYLSVLERQWKRIRLVRPECSAPGSWSLLHDNAPLYRAVAVQEFLARKQVCVLNYPPYSPDLSPCDYFLFLKLNLPLKVRLFEDIKTSKSCDIESSGHTTRRGAEVVPVFARSCHSPYRCRRDVL